MLRSNRCDRSHDKYLSKMKEIDASALVSKAIVKDAREYISRAWEDIVDSFMARCRELPKDDPLMLAVRDWSWNGSHSLHHMSGALKRFHKAISGVDLSDHPKRSELVDEFLKEADYFMLALETAKKAMTKIGTPQEVRIAKLPPAAPMSPLTRKQIAMAQKAISAVIDEFVPELREQITLRLLAQKERGDEELERAKNEPALRSDIIKRLRHSQWWTGTAAHFYECTGRNEYELKENWQQIFDSMRDDITKSMCDVFETKQVAKLGRLMNDENPVSRVTANFSAAQSHIEAAVGVETIDGSSFNMRTQLVYSWSKNGVMFARYPTTFHDFMAAGEFLAKQLSEEEIRVAMGGKKDAAVPHAEPQA